MQKPSDDLHEQPDDLQEQPDDLHEQPGKGNDQSGLIKWLPIKMQRCALGGSKNTNFQNSMGALSNHISFAIRISKQFCFRSSSIGRPSPKNFQL